MKGDRPMLRKNISSAPLFLFYKVSYDWVISIIINCILFFVTVFYLDKRVLFCIYRKYDYLKMGAAALEMLQKS